MGLMTAREYRDSLRDGRVVYLCGEQVTDVYAHPMLKTCIDTAAIDYEMAEMPEYRDLAVVELENGERISRYYSIPNNGDDLLKRHELMVEATRLGGGAMPFTHDIASDTLNAITITANLMGNTDYVERASAYRRFLQQKDLAVAAAVTDVKGDRSKRPSSPEQAHPDLYLRVVHRDTDGIIVRGAKAHITAAAYFNEIIVIPSRNMTADDADYAVAFAIPVDTKGIIQICHPVPTENHPLEFPAGDRPLRWHTDSLVIFDDVFIPWERVFLFGEWQYAMHLVYNFAFFHRNTAASYRIPMTELLLGMAVAMAEYNGIDRQSHVRDKLTNMLFYLNMLKSLCRAACVDYVEHGGIATPNPVITNMAKYYFADNYHDFVKVVQDMSGGLLSTAPTYRDFQNPALADHIKKYLVGRKGVSAEARLRMLQLIRRHASAEMEVLAIHGEGSLEAERMMILAESFGELQRCKRLAEQEAGIVEGSEP